MGLVLLAGASRSGAQENPPPLPQMDNLPGLQREPALPPVAEAPLPADPIPTRVDDAPLKPALWSPPPPASVSASGAESSSGVVPVAAQNAPRQAGKPKEDADFTVLTELPGPHRLFQRESENQVFERLRREAISTRTGSTRVFFPEEEPLTREPFVPRMFPPSTMVVEPSFVCHRRLFFEQKNFERAGWDLGPFQPALCLGIFYFDVATFPYHYGTRPCQRYDCSAGKCLPGDPTPLLLYPWEWSWTGAVLQAGVVGAAIAIFP